MSLRNAILKAAVPLIPQQGFTRAALSAALASLPTAQLSSSSSSSGAGPSLSSITPPSTTPPSTTPPSTTPPSTTPPSPTSTPSTASAGSSLASPAARESILDTLFGATPSSGARALVSAWEDAGAAAMRPTGGHGGLSPDERVLDALQRRLEWSASAGDHLVDAHALLAGPTTSLALPPPLQAAMDRFAPSAVARAIADAGGRVPLPLPPVLGADAAADDAAPGARGPLAYAWRVADEAVYAAQPDRGRTGVMREPAGAGVEWYAQRMGIAVVYLLAELRLVNPPADAAPLPAALASLRDNMGAYARARSTFGGLENAVDDAVGFLELATRSVAGILRSRGF